MNDLTDEQIGTYWDTYLAGYVADIPDDAAVERMRESYIADVRANPEATRQLAEHYARQREVLDVIDSVAVYVGTCQCCGERTDSDDPAPDLCVLCLKAGRP